MSPLFLVLLAQVGAAPAVGTSPLETPPEVRERRARQQQQAPSAAMPGTVPGPNRGGCIAEVEADPKRGAEVARDALAEAIGDERARAGLCLGMALLDLERFDEAQKAFLDARNATTTGQYGSRARLGAMAGNAALAAGKPDSALAMLDAAQGDAVAGGDKALAGTIAVSRARALVALGRTEDAGKALEQARMSAPGDAEAWLLSATLARRENRLDEAQRQIEQAARLAPEDPQIGLEAGVIAVLSGHDDAARKSWRSVVATAPQSPAAETARGYLAQLDPVQGPQP
ncbi:hypothetical protein B2G71_12340 [Novosphingobium sp. PC22D]|uniref:tetratricopeptide repeat protein n=1 Tax=Novosphingobium sp. PC22D TaxID=1962403 RepID=UPI000BEF1B1F|nr:tetratricopeptide repeat protein [Novosphingobium sp. PC22D]PEQ12289.1 hypothetical protein B2G71_12340 [Novosphingobium sp. PC22D]